MQQLKLHSSVGLHYVYQLNAGTYGLITFS